MSPRAGLDDTVVFQAAVNLADEEGLLAVTMARLAQRLKVRPPSLYNHIEGLPELRRRLHLYALEQLYSFLKQKTENVQGDEAVFALGEAYILFARQHPGLYEATLAAPNPGEREQTEAGGKIVSLILHLLTYLKLDQTTALHTIRGLRSMLHGFCSLQQQRGFKIPLSLEESLHFGLEAYLSGIKGKNS